MNRPFCKHIGSGRGSRIEWDVIVENGRVWFEQENDGYMFMRRGPEASRRELPLDSDSHWGRAQHLYHEAVAEAKRQRAAMVIDEA